ncbi:MAG: hypothetical protein NTZ80_02985 [Patescibacteria group bacterium]|nr:hypothetical protein [Patescibacteria group bacterium]
MMTDKSMFYRLEETEETEATDEAEEIDEDDSTGQDDIDADEEDAGM